MSCVTMRSASQAAANPLHASVKTRKGARCAAMVPAAGEVTAARDVTAQAASETSSETTTAGADKGIKWQTPKWASNFGANTSLGRLASGSKERRTKGGRLLYGEERAQQRAAEAAEKKAAMDAKMAARLEETMAKAEAKKAAQQARAEENLAKNAERKARQQKEVEAKYAKLAAKRAASASLNTIDPSGFTGRAPDGGNVDVRFNAAGVFPGQSYVTKRMPVDSAFGWDSFLRSPTDKEKARGREKRSSWSKALLGIDLTQEVAEDPEASFPKYLVAGEVRTSAPLALPVGRSIAAVKPEYEKTKTGPTGTYVQNPKSNRPWTW